MNLNQEFNSFLAEHLYKASMQFDALAKNWILKEFGSMDQALLDVHNGFASIQVVYLKNPHMNSYDPWSGELLRVEDGYIFKQLRVDGKVVVESRISF